VAPVALCKNSQSQHNSLMGGARELDFRPPTLLSGRQSCLVRAANLGVARDNVQEHPIEIKSRNLVRWHEIVVVPACWFSGMSYL
jgi:hypothetical protein